jgi:lauroyl/myristoyl acyltransferase
MSITGWKPEVELRGLEHLETARQRGAGTILWRVSCHCAIPLNQALAREGFPAVHLSRTNHLLLNSGAFFNERVGPRVAPLLRRGEEAPLLDRVAFTDETAASATRRLIKVLRANGLVTIVGDLGTGRGRHPVMINNEEVALANGGAKLSVTTGAALLPVTMTRTAPLRYRVDVLPPLIAPSGVGRDEAVISLIEQFADIVADLIRRDPPQWPRWRGPTS